MNTQTLIDAARALGPVLAALPQVVEVFETAMSGMSETDQDEARRMLADLRTENDALHTRLQDKLADAARR